MTREQQALPEFIKRAKRGMYPHPPLWLVMGAYVRLFATLIDEAGATIRA